MDGRPFQHFLGLLLLLQCLKTGLGSSLMVGDAKVGCTEREREALLHFKQGVVDHYRLLSSWGKGEDKRDCCQWTGVECNNQTGDVISLDFRTLDDYLPLGGKIGPSLGELQHLKHLNLSHNDFEGVLPTQLGNLSNLQSLDLSYNLNVRCENLDWLSGLPLLTHLDLSGVNLSKAIQWPLAINKMPSLTELYLRSTHLPGIIPTVSISLINSSTSLAVLDLYGNGLTSSIYPWLFNSSSSLVHLELSDNDLNGSIPDAFGNMTTLAVLDLSTNEFEGEIPKSLSTSLVHLDLSYNDLNGSIPDAFGNMTTLAYLDLSYNHLRGSIPDAFGNMTTLAYLHLSYNDLNGAIPDAFGNMTSLAALDLSHNGLNGSIPDAFGNMTTLEALDLSSNQLGGVFPTQLGSASELYYLDLSFNSITFNISLEQAPQFQAVSIRLASCKLGPRFPTWLQTQKRLLALDISASGISDVIPNWFWKLTSDLELLNISNNHISGTLPNFQLIGPLSTVDMRSNCLEGPLPQSLRKAQWLDLSNNLFSGSISLLCGTYTWHLCHLDLSNNLLSGELPNCWDQLENLTVLNLANNTFSGKIKNSIGSLHQIQTLHLRNNSLTGALPTSLKNCKHLHLVDFGSNKLSGKIPAWMGRSLSSLVVLNLRSNQFNGSIPSNLCQLKKIQVLDLSSNNLSGAIPKCLNNFTALTQKGSIVIAYNETLIAVARGEISYIDNTWIQWKGKESEYGKTLGFVKSIDFSSNKLTGEIPLEVTDLVELVSLNLSRNNLTGSIPSMIGQLRWLDALDLSQNQLHGGIPASLSQIADLSFLDLSNNTLSGKIPSGTQLQSFNASRYEGNPGLCGPPLLKKCLEDEPGEVSFTGPSNKEDIQDDANDIWFYGSVALGFIIGFWGVCGTLLLNSAWRYAYFQFLGKVKDWLYVMMTVSMNRLWRSLQS